MRKRFKQDITLDGQRISEVQIDPRSRHQLPQLLAGLQYIFVTPDLNNAIFTLLAEHIIGETKQTGRIGMSLWEIFVLGTVRLNLDIDYDELHDLANHHIILRGIMGIETTGLLGSSKRYGLQTIKDNVRLLTEDLLKQINLLIVKAGHELKKKETESAIALCLKTDTYVVESNIHFPTDLNLLWDSARKCLTAIKGLLTRCWLSGWRKWKYWFKQLKSYYRKTANIHQKKGSNYQTRLQASTQSYLAACEALNDKLVVSMDQIVERESLGDLRILTGLEELIYYKEMLCKHIDLVNRRILLGEKIPHSEKVFSIFETHVEWLTKGKLHKKVELGHQVLITTDQFHFILDHKVLVGERDAAQPISLAHRLQDNFEDGYRLESISFDRGFHSKLAKEALQKIFNQVVMPKKGKKSVAEQEEQSSPLFVKNRKAHSAVESNINELEHSGLNRVLDKGLGAFYRYTALGVVAYNLKRLGRIVIEQDLLPSKNKKEKAQVA